MPNKIKMRHGISVKDFEKIVTDMRGGDGIFKSLRQGTLSFAEFLSKLNPFGEQFTSEQVEQLNNERNVIRQEELKKEEIDTPYKIKKAEIAQEKVKLRSEERRARLSLAETRAHNRNVAPGFIRQFIDAFFKPLWKNAAPYIILAFVLILILLVLTGGLKRKSGGGGAHFNPITSLLRAGKKLARTGVNDVKYVGKGIYSESSYIVRKIRAFFNSIIKFFQRLFHPLYKINKLANMLTGGAHNNTLDRTKIESGRCDNMSWVETSTEGAQGTCTKSAHPIDLTWNLNNTQTPEYFDLPSTRKGQIDKYSTVKIPWDVNPEASFYVPQCEKAYYPKTCTSSGICVKADMFIDLGLSCKLKDDKLPTQYPDAKGKPVTSFDDTSVKSCININTLVEQPCK